MSTPRQLRIDAAIPNWLTLFPVHVMNLSAKAPAGTMAASKRNAPRATRRNDAWTARRRAVSEALHSGPGPRSFVKAAWEIPAPPTRRVLFHASLRDAVFNERPADVNLYLKSRPFSHEKKGMSPSAVFPEWIRL